MTRPRLPFAYLLPAALFALPACKQPPPHAAIAPPAVASTARSAAPTEPASPFHEVAEGRNGDNEYHRPSSSICPVRNAILTCPQLEVLDERGVTTSEAGPGDTPRDLRDLAGTWPDRLWATSRVMGVVVHATSSRWKTVVDLGHLSVGDMYLTSAVEGDGYVVARQRLVPDMSHPDCRGRSEARCGWQMTDLRITRFSGTEKHWDLTLPRRGNKRVVTSFAGAAGFDDGSVVVSGRGGAELYQGPAVAVRWRPNTATAEVLPEPGCSGSIVGSSADDFMVVGENEWHACAVRIHGTSVSPVTIPTGREVRSAAVESDGTAWMIVASEIDSEDVFRKRARLFRRRPGGDFEPVALPPPALGRLPPFGLPEPRSVHLDRQGNVWVDAMYIEDCVRSVIYTTAPVPLPCVLGEHGCTTDERTHRWEYCPDMRK